MRDIVHLPARSADHTWLCQDWVEARWLWDLLNQRTDFIALVIMLDHIHALCFDRDLPAVKDAMRAFAIRRNALRGESGRRVWRHKEQATLIKTEKQRNVVGAYIHRNPVVDGLVDDPLAWPFSTHRDAVGLAIPGVRRAVPNPQDHHERVSHIRERPHLKPRPLPDGVQNRLGRIRHADRRAGRSEKGDTDELLRQIRDAVSALTRTPEEWLAMQGPARSLLLRSARCLTHASTRGIAAFAGVSPMTVSRQPRSRTREVSLVERVLGDDRFALLRTGHLRHLFPGG